MRQLIIALFTALAVALAGCQASRPAANAAAARPFTDDPATGNTSLQPEPYTRIARPDANTVQLQIAVRKFVPARHRGPTLWLAGTSHVGEPGYYHALQKHFDTQTVVLYEGINTGAHKRHVTNPGAASATPDLPPSTPPTQPHPSGGFSMQSALAESLGLVFQLDAIDYERTNFINSDLSILQIQRLMLGDKDAVPAPPGVKGKTDPSFEFLLQIMDGSSFLGSLFKMGIQLIGSSPQLQAVAKLTLVETLGQIKGDFSQMRGLPPDMKRLVKVLIEARNQNVVDDLKTEFKSIPRAGSISVFYGTGHMEDMEKRIVRDLHYRPDGEIWLTAFSVDVRKTGLSPTELQMMRNVVKWQLDQMQP
ncbi:MAG TPA: hypothetical protein VFC07_07690 [Verrucomicrobiae bacterium]|nr:hypothetical protein [Verrucomicrobiae bacterium]